MAPLGSPVTKLAGFRLVKLRVAFVENFSFFCLLAGNISDLNFRAAHLLRGAYSCRGDSTPVSYLSRASASATVRTFTNTGLYIKLLVIVEGEQGGRPRELHNVELHYFYSIIISSSSITLDMSLIKKTLGLGT
jgi:hypothetical protein